MKISTTKINGYSLVKIEGSLTIEYIKNIEQQVDQCLDEGRDVILDFCELSFICSAALSFLLASNQKANAKSLRLSIVNCNNDIRNLFNLTELDKHLSIFSSVEEARRNLES